MPQPTALGVEVVPAGSTPAFGTPAYDDGVAAAYSPVVNVVGYDWKTFAGGTYVTPPEKVCFVRDAVGVYYKLHFADYLNSAGVKGAPKWEVLRFKRFWQTASLRKFITGVD